MQRAQEATTAALVEYFYGSMERAIPLLQKSIELDRRQMRAFAAAYEKAGLRDWNELEPAYFHLLALTHGRLARAYFLTNRREECLNQVALAVNLGTSFVAMVKREAMLQGLAEEYGMDSAEKAFAVVQRYDTADRPRIRPAQRDDAERAASENEYTPGKADCLLQSDARQPLPPQQGR